jgi:acyl-ACP thioesterase
MGEKIREYFHRVESRDVDFMRKSTIMALGDYVLNIAGEDADINGFGVRQLNASHNASWVLVRMTMEVEGIPDEHERLRIATWVSDVSRVMTTRNFEVFDADDRRIATAVTNWTMINLDTRRPMDLHALDDYGRMMQPVPSPLAELPRKLHSPASPTFSHHMVVYSDVDFNCHANSMKYLQWVVDTLPLEVLENRRFARVDMNFIHESRHGELLTIAAEDDMLFEILNSAGKSVCRIAIEMTDRTCRYSK